MKGKKYLLLFCLLPLVLSGIVALFTMNDVANYQQLILPSFAPPGYLFSIVWPILYILMGISSYLIYISHDVNTSKALIIYAIQLFVNLVWPILFFTFEAYLISTIWLFMLVGLVLFMILYFYDISPLSAYLQIPYLLWILFALYLNFSIFLYN